MFKPFLLCTSLLISSFAVFANDYDKAWEALKKNDRKQAREYLARALNDPQTATDAYITSVFLKEFEGGEVGHQFHELVMEKVNDVNPYLFAMWFNDAVVGQYGKKSRQEQIDLLQELWKRADVNGSIRAASRYVLAHHYLASNQYDKAFAEWASIGSVGNWQLVGPFDNLSGSGFYKSYGPLENAGPNASFRSLSNAEVKWFTPANLSQEGWVFLNSHIPNSTAISYAQSFVYAPQDMKIMVNAGVSGSLKVWVNDGLVISESKERITELDCYRSPTELKKGYNRILVQLGVTGNSSANFIIRLTDINGLALQGLTSKAELQTYAKQPDNKELKPVRHFAEAFFEDRIRQQPNNPVNYILLSQTYLRNQKTFEARKLIQSALKKYPESSLLRYELIQCLIKEGSRTLLSTEVERMKETDPECYFVYSLKIDELMDEEKYEEAMSLYDKLTTIYPEDADLVQDKIRILVAREKLDEAIKLIRESYEKYPSNMTFVNMMYNLEKNVYKNQEKAMDIYRQYLKTNWNFQVYKGLADDYIEQGKKEEGLRILKDIERMFPYDAGFLTGRLNYYFQQQDYKTALEYGERALKLAPFVASYWENKALVQEQAGDEEQAIENYRKALYFDSKLYETRKKLRALEKKPELYKNFPQTDVYELIRQSYNEPMSPDHDYSFLLDEKLAILYSDGAAEEYMTLVIRIHTEKGIDHWKESYIPYNSNAQNMLIEKAEIVKKNGSKLTAEANGNDLVFTSLEAGDALVIKYRLQDYSSGRLGKEYWDRYSFNTFNPTGVIRYCLLVDKKVSPSFKVANATLKPSIKDFDDFQMYTWQVTRPETFKDEPFMPSLNDVGLTLHISTMKSWNEVARWYSDISYSKTDGEYELKDAYDEIFAGSGKLSDMEKARKIYNYIQKNIRYSSVSFRQSAYVPQSVSVTINTRLGDCKDLSSLFVSLAKLAGIKSNLVLVDTKDNGTQEMLLPSVEFNHCIILLRAGSKDIYLELTDNSLPFGSLPNNLPGASSLIIPGEDDHSMVSSLKPLPDENRTKDVIRRTVDISIKESDLKINTEIFRKGALTSSMRDQYRNLTGEKLRESMEESVSSQFKNPVRLNSVVFTGLEELLDSVVCSFDFQVADEVVEVGEMQMFKLPFGDMIATLDNFSKDNRQFPFEYWRYENVDEYETIIHVTVPEGKKLIELPKDEDFEFNHCRYSLRYKVTGTGKLTITRKASLVRDDISPKDYPAFKEFMKKIVKAESKYVAFK